jgi:hypothetical protein
VTGDLKPAAPHQPGGLYELDAAARAHHGSALLSYTDALTLAAHAAGQRDPRLDLHMTAVHHTSGVRRRGWEVLDGHGTVLASGRCLTRWGMYRRRFRAYLRLLTQCQED